MPKKTKVTSKETSQKEKSSPKEKHFLTVGIGASAGGIKALREFFAAMPSDSGMAFVVILHLSESYKSSLAEILQRETKMRVEQVNETVKVEPNHVYVIPPAKHLEMTDGVIKLKAPPHTKGVRVPIDRFFRTMALAYGRKAVCIILSGTGSDGTIGMKQVKDQGGFAMIQDPKEAEYDGMPRSAIDTKIADIVLPIAAMPEKLLFVRDTTEKFRLTESDDGDISIGIKNIDLLRDVLTLLRVRTGHDFSNYKRPTLIRRLVRHLQIYETDDLKEYLEILRKKPEEVLSLLKNLLINVTNFFRDKETFAVLEEKVIPALFENKSSSDQVRVWIAGCSTGEEAYSIAILLSEYAATLSDPPRIQIFASDVDDDAIAEAREGHFSESAIVDVSPERLHQFFTRQDDNGYQIRKSIREMILFAPHNILRDPPFSRLDLVSCRNVLIYLNRETQEQILKVFHFALNEGSYLFLGSSETAEGAPNHFSAVDKKHRIYQSRPTAVGWNMPPALPLPGFWSPRLQQQESPVAHTSLQSFGELHHRLIEHYAPPSVLVNEEGEILHLSENAGRFLRFAGGEPSANIMKVIHPALLSDLRAALFTARKENKTAEAKNIRVKFNGEEKRVNIMVRAVGIPEAAALIMFEEIPDELPGEEPDHTIVTGDKAMESVVRRMEEELKRTKDQLRNTIEQYETSTEELKASNEELQAINEELRSASEELETSKEELQSVNEELTTVNNELKEKVDETMRANSDLQNLMHSTDIATIFLDRSLHIKRYTPRATEIFNLIPTDVGRPLSHITNRLDPDNFQDDANKSLQNLQTFEREVHAGDGRFFIARFSPYRTLDDKIEGVVISFINITEREKAEEHIREAMAYAEAIIETIREPLLVLDKDLRVLSANHSFYNTFKVLQNDCKGRFVYDLGNRQWDNPKLRELLENILPKKNQFENFEVTYDFETIGQRTMLLNGREIFRGSEKDRLILLAMEDITEHKKAEEELRISEVKYRKLFNSIDDAFCIIEMIFDDKEKPVDFRYLETNDSFVRHATMPMEGKRIKELVPDFEQFWIEQYAKVAKTGEVVRLESTVAGLGNQWFQTSAFPVDGINRVGVLFQNVTMRKHREANIALLDEISEDLMRMTNLGEIMNAICKKISTTLHLARCLFVEIKESEDKITVLHDWHLPELPGIDAELTLSQFVSKPYLQQSHAGETIVVPDVYKSPLVNGNEVKEQLGIASFVNVPLRVKGQWRFTAGIYDTAPRDWQREDIELLRELTSRVYKRMEQINIEEALQRSEENYRIIVNQAVVGMLKIDTSDRITFVNHHFCTMLGYTEEELLQMNFVDLIYEKDKQRHLNRFDAMKADKKEYIIEKRMICKNGNLIWGRNYNSPLFDQEGRFREAIIISMDISFEKAIDQQKDDFISIASHELKTPLTSVKGYVELLNEMFTETGTITSDSLIIPLNEQVNRLAKLVTSLLDTSQIANGKLELHQEIFDMNDLIKEIGASFELISEKHLLITETSGAIPVYADRERMGQVLSNLISNAIKYSPDGGNIIVTSERGNHEVKVGVRDAGIGMSPEVLHKIFKRFYRVIKDHYPGFGLGLYISMEIIKMHHGSLAVESEVGKGSFFYFTLPDAVLVENKYIQ